MAELPHADALQQLEVPLLGLPAVKLIDIILASLQSTSSTQHQAVPLQPSISTSVSPPTPTVPIVGVTDTKEPAEATATSSGVQVTTPLSQKESTPSKCWCIFPMLIPATTQRSHSPSGTLSSSASSPLPIVVVPELTSPPYAHPE